MTELINDVLTVSKAEAGKIEYNPSKINLYELSNNICQNVKLAVTDKIQFNFEYNLEEKIFALDHKLITQILSNLLSNAVKYSPEGGIVSLVINKENDDLILSVTDEGIGIPEEDLSRLFEPFYRSQNVGTISGTGLGLSIAQKSVEIMGGKLLVNSKVNEGTKMIVVLKCI